ncbi:TNF receptor-associated factor 1 [Gastrophryne carolinensis]
MEQVKRGPVSTPDENEFVFGYPTSICDDKPRNKYLCCNCNNVLKKAQQTLCGHRYCMPCLAWIVRNKKSPICPKCQQEDPDSLSEESYLSEERAFCDAAINKEIAELRVHCVMPGCHWSGLLGNYEKHKCEQGSSADLTMGKMEAVPQGQHSDRDCRDRCCFSSLGCNYQGSKKKIAEHEKTSAAMHLSLALPILLQLKDSLSPSAIMDNGLHARPPAVRSRSSNLHNGAVNGQIAIDSGGQSRSAGEELHARLALLEARSQVFENIITVLNREVESANIRLAAALQQNAEQQQRVKACEQQISNLCCTLAQKESALNELQVHLMYLQQTSYDGIFLWKISNLNQKCQDAMTGRAVSLYSPAFYTARYGYKACLRIYLNGDGAGKGTHVSLFFAVMKGEYDALLPWPFSHKVTFILLDQTNREHAFDAFRPDVLSASFQRPVSDMNIASGCPLFCPLTKLQAARNNYVKEDTMFIRCIIDTNS